MIDSSLHSAHVPRLPYLISGLCGAAFPSKINSSIICMEALTCIHEVLEHYYDCIHYSHIWKNKQYKLLLSTLLVAGRVQNCNIAAEVLFVFSEFFICLADLLCLTKAPLPILPKSNVTWQVLHLKLCLLIGSGSNHDWNNFSSLHWIWWTSCLIYLKSYKI